MQVNQIYLVMNFDYLPSYKYGDFVCGLREKIIKKIHFLGVASMQNIQSKLEKNEYNYSDYTAENHLTWKKLFDRQTRKVEGKACQEFIDGLDKLYPFFKSLPNLEILSENLHKLVGWRLYPAVGLVEAEEFFELLANKYFPVSILIRSLAELDFAADPDMWHDIFGHLPFLFDLEYQDFIAFISEKIVIANAEKKKQLSALYWYTIEAGVCQEKGKRRLYGTSQLSSFTEIDYALSPQPTVIPFDFKTVINTEVNMYEIQKTLFEIPSLKYLKVIKDQIADFMQDEPETLVPITNRNYQSKKAIYEEDKVAA